MIASRTLFTGAMALFCLHPLVASGDGPGEAETALRWKWNEGDELRLTVSSKRSLKTRDSADPLRAHEQELSTTIYATWKVLGVDSDGTARIACRMERIRLSDETPGLVPLEYDLTPPHDEDIEHPFASVYSKLVGGECRFRMSPSGTVTSFDLAGEVKKRFEKPDDDRGPTPEQARALCERRFTLFPPLPQEPVSEGQTWEKEVREGEFSLRERFTHEGALSSRGRKLHSIGIAGEIAATAGASTEVLKSEVRGNALFDEVAGRYVETERRTLEELRRGTTSTLSESLRTIEFQGAERDEDIEARPQEEAPAAKAYRLARRATALQQRHCRNEAKELAEAAIKILRRLIETEERRDLLEYLAWCLEIEASLEPQPEATPLHEEIVGIYRELIGEQHRRDLEPRLATVLIDRGFALRSAGRTADAEKSFSDAIDLLTCLVQEKPEEWMFHQLARAAGGRAYERSVRDKHAEAATDQELRIRVYRRLVEEFGRTELRREIAESLSDRAESFLQCGKPEEAIRDLDEALRICGRLEEHGARKTPNGTYYPLRTSVIAAGALKTRAVALAWEGNLSEAKADINAAVDLYKELVEGGSKNLQFALDEAKEFREHLKSKKKL